MGSSAFTLALAAVVLASSATLITGRATNRASQLKKAAALLDGEFDGMSGEAKARGRKAQGILNKLSEKHQMADDPELRLLTARAYRAQWQAKKAEDILSALGKEKLPPPLRVRVLLESGHLYYANQMWDSATKLYQTAHDEAPAGSEQKDAAKQGGAMSMAKNGKCDKGNKSQACFRSLAILLEVPADRRTPFCWKLIAHMYKELHDDVSAAAGAIMRALDAAGPDHGRQHASWWLQLSRWAQMVHHRSSDPKVSQEAVKRARAAYVRAHELNPFSAPTWTEKVQSILNRNNATSETSAGANVEEHSCRDPIRTLLSHEAGHVKPGEQTVFHLPHADPDYACDEIDIDDISANGEDWFFWTFMIKHRPVIIKNATKNWPVSPFEWSEKRLADIAGDEVIEVAFTKEDGHLNRFEPMAGKWAKEFKDKHWQVNDKVLVRPKYEHLYFRDYLALLHRGGHAPERNSYLHQAEMHMNFPQLLNLTSKPSYMTANIVHKETNLWMSAGGTVTSLHYDKSENIMHMVSGEKEFLLFRPNQKEHLHYEDVPEIRFDDTKGGPTGRINKIHGLVDPTNVDWDRYPQYKNAHGLRCHVRQGDALYVPSHWHHAVYSPPGASSEQCRNIGINYWYIASMSEIEAQAAHPWKRSDGYQPSWTHPALLEDQTGKAEL